MDLEWIAITIGGFARISLALVIGLVSRAVCWIFDVGLKLNFGKLGWPQVWAVAGIHMSVAITVFGFAVEGLALVGAPFVACLEPSREIWIAFAPSFSSTVFVLKHLEKWGKMACLHDRIAIGILILQ